MKPTKKTSVEFLLQSFGHNLSKIKEYIIDYQIDEVLLLDDSKIDANTFCYDIEEFVKPINLQ